MEPTINLNGSTLNVEIEDNFVGGIAVGASCLTAAPVNARAEGTVSQGEGRRIMDLFEDITMKALDGITLD